MTQLAFDFCYEDEEIFSNIINEKEVYTTLYKEIEYEKSLERIKELEKIAIRKIKQIRKLEKKCQMIILKYLHYQ